MSRDGCFCPSACRPFPPCVGNVDIPDRPAIRIHPNMAEIYRLKVAELEVALNDDSIKAEAGDILRSLIDRVVLSPVANAPDGIEAQLHGDLAAILALSNDDGRKQKLPAEGAAGSLLSVVAGARNHLYRTKVSALSTR
jgi:site-specific DNA recombinase